MWKESMSKQGRQLISFYESRGIGEQQLQRLVSRTFCIYTLLVFLVSFFDTVIINYNAIGYAHNRLQKGISRLKMCRFRLL
jgi:hypothetical protein